MRVSRRIVDIDDGSERLQSDFVVFIFESPLVFFKTSDSVLAGIQHCVAPNRLHCWRAQKQLRYWLVESDPFRTLQPNLHSESIPAVILDRKSVHHRLH